MNTDLYDIKELCSEAGVTARTVHFYIQQGLLPPASVQGPGARYTNGHMARLKLIRRLQKEHLPLSEIRRRLESLDDMRVEELVREDDSLKPSSSSAIEYIRNILGGTRHRPSQSAAANLLRTRVSCSPEEDRNADYSTRRVGERSQWERLVLTSDIELHIRRPLSRSQNRKIEALIQQAREILREE